MLRYLLFFSLIFQFGLLGPENSTRVVEWLTPLTHDFGDIPFGQDTHHTFKFRNISDDSIRIDNVRTTCGCTAPDWSDELIAPDSVGTVRIRYDASKKGAFRKKILVFFSGQRKGDKLFIEGETMRE